MGDKLPFMPFYGADFYEDEAVAMMDPVEECAYLRLLWRQWREGSLPDELPALERLARLPISDRVASLLPLGTDQRRRNPRLEEIRQQHTDVLERKSEGGKAGRAKQLALSELRQSPKKGRGKPGQSPGTPRGELGQPEPEPEPEPDTTPSPNGTATASAAAASWPAEGASILQVIGEFAPGRVGRALSPVVRRYGWPRTREMLEAFAQLGPHQKADGSFDRSVQAYQFCTPERFAQAAGFWFQQTEPITTGKA